MNNILKNLGLLVVILVLSYFTAGYFGSWYDKFSPQHDSLFGASKSITNVVVGGPFSYIFFLIITFKLFASGNKNKWIGWLLVPPALLFASGDLRHIYLPIALALIAFGLATLIRKVLQKS